MSSPASRSPSALTRRDFLKFSGLSLLSAALPPIGQPLAVPRSQQGRVIDPSIVVYDIPSFTGRQVRRYWHDTVVSLTAATVGDDEPAYNRVWYRIGSEGYAHSGSIQPVQTRLNPVVDSQFPSYGQLAEVTVPYTDAHWRPGKYQPVAYRFYYETTHWVGQLVQDDYGNPWYRIIEDKWDLVYYVPAEHLRLIATEELFPLSPRVPAKDKRLEVRTAEQIVVAYERDRPVFAARAATGARFSNGAYYTPSGRHMTFHKRPSRHMAAGNLAANGYDLPGVPWVCYITEKGVALHGTYWHNDFGRPRSHGCINLSSQAAKWFYRWTLPVVPPGMQRVYKTSGTIVDVF
jgi:lipoprotein-anchoring transpeptidase ErfK/SrfK